jgi:hypothetical protein
LAEILDVNALKLLPWVALYEAFARGFEAESRKDGAAHAADARRNGGGVLADGARE